MGAVASALGVAAAAASVSTASAEPDDEVVLVETVVPPTVPDETVEAVVIQARAPELGSGKPIARPWSAGVTDGLTVRDIPLRALTAYGFADATMRRAARDCGLDWHLLAAVGHVESRHGQLEGSRLTREGLARPALRGDFLDAASDLPRPPDTDGGRLDGERRWDRPVGPMQILPSVWRLVGIDADGNGIRNPDDMDDAALATAVHLCAAPGDLTSRQGRLRALRVVNPSDGYAEAVLAVARSYRASDVVASEPPATALALPEVELTRPATGRPTAGKPSGSDPGGTPTRQDRQPRQPTPIDRPDPGSEPKPDSEPEPEPKPEPRPEKPDPRPVDDPQPKPDDEPKPGNGSTPDDEPQPQPAPAPGPADQPVDKPSEQRPDEPQPEPEPAPKPDKPEPEPEPAPKPDKPKPEPQPAPKPEPQPEPQPEAPGCPESGLKVTPGTTAEVTGVLSWCEDAWFVGETRVDVGSAEHLAATALADHDGDGTVETNADEISGMAGREVTATLGSPAAPGVDAPVLLLLGTTPYLSE